MIPQVPSDARSEAAGTSRPLARTFGALVADYKNTAEQNETLHAALTELTWSTPYLAAHRRHCELNKLGFGDAAFHCMWEMLLREAARRFDAPRCLEIGVFKGQAISAWSLIAREANLHVRVSGITPLRGNPAPRSRLLRKLQSWFDSHFREEMNSGNFYEDADYESIIQDLYRHFGLDFGEVELHRGFSTDPAILLAISSRTYHLIYVDGDHSYEGALHDFERFAPKVEIGGWLVADDAGCDLPGGGFWKGHESVSRAARRIPEYGFLNVLNVGHIRIYERVR